MKSCLKCATDAASSPASHDLSRSPPDSPSSQSSAGDRPKSVSFCEVSEEDVFYVDDWDRSPAAVTERLTYRCVLVSLSFPYAVFKPAAAPAETCTSSRSCE